jgi:serine/threonine-protein kinase RsbW
VQRNLKSPIDNDQTPNLEENAQSSPTHFEVTLPADVALISPVVSWVMRLVSDMEFVPAKEFEIELALRETLANAITHGCQGDSAKKVEISISEERARGILVIVRDPGQGFDPAAIPCPTDEENVHSDHGRGIYLINRLMDEVKYERNGSEIRMRKYR